MASDVRRILGMANHVIRIVAQLSVKTILLKPLPSTHFEFISDVY